MKIFTYSKMLIACTISLFLFTQSFAQSPGTIVNPKNPGFTFLNPDGNRYSAKTPAGFTNNDLFQSEIDYKIVPAAMPEPVGDQNNGPTGGSTDFVPNPADGNGFYTYFNGTHVMFRFRVGSMPKGSKGFSVLIDTDLRIGLDGFYADPNYVAASNSRSGNPGFELEIVYDFGKNVVVRNVDGSLTGTVLGTFAESTHAQISIALSKTSGDADYFVDFGVPVSVLGPIDYIRIVGTTGTSSGSALSNNAADVFGVSDLPHKNLIPNWEDLISYQCGFPVSAIGLNGGGICVCTPRPVLDSPIGVGFNISVSGIWNRLHPTKSSQAVITLYKNEVVIGTTIATTGVPWSFTVPSIYSGDMFYAKAQAAPEFMCLQSDPVFATCTASLPPSPTVTCASTKGIQGTIPLGATVLIYEVTGTNSNPSYNQLSGGVSYTNNGGNQTFTYHGPNPITANQCQNGNAGLATGNYYVVTNVMGCVSYPTSICIYGSNQNDWGGIALNGITVNAPVYNSHKSVSGTGATVGSLLRLYLNNVYISSLTTTATTFTFNNLSLKVGDVIRVAQQSTAPGSCLTTSLPSTVQCFTHPPNIWTNLQGKLSSTSTFINGACNSVGASITLYRGTQPGGVVAGTTSVTKSGLWEVTGLTIMGGQTYYAVANAGCPSVASAQADVWDPEPVCAYISGSYTESANNVSGTFESPFTGTVRLYLDSIVLKTWNVNNSSNWSVNVNNLDVDLYPGGKLFITTQSVGWNEKQCQAPITVTCDMPSTPAVSPISVTIYQGETANFSINNSDSRFLYSLVDASKSNYAPSKFGSDGSMPLASYKFDTPGTYNLQLAADNISGSTCSATTSVQVTVNYAVLPVKFISMAVKKNNDGTKQISWSVTNGKDISHYEIEKSTDGLNYNVIATQRNRSTTDDVQDYTNQDATAAFLKNIYYRIKAISIDGKIAYSKTVVLTEEIKAPLVAPNPANTEATIYFNSDRDQSVAIDLFDLNGRLVLNKQLQVSEGRNSVTIDGLSKYAKGQYFIQLKTATDIHHLKLQIK